ncbi:MAG: hypothetical protein RR865_08200 [Clostridia bacterium]
MSTLPVDPNPFFRSQKRVDWLKWALFALVFALSYLVFYMLCLRPASDISIHATWAAEGDFLHPRSFLHHGAHPMWHGFVAFLLLFRIPLPMAAALVTALCKALEFWLVQRLFTLYLGEALHRYAVSLLALVCVTVSCLCIPAYNPTVYLGVGTPNTWHSCTQLMAMVWMLLCVPYTAHCYDAFTRLLPAQGDKTLLPWKKPLLLGLLLFLSLLAKPTFMQAFLPAACLFFLVMWLRHPKNSRFFGQIIICVLPAVLFMIVQYLYYFGIIVPSQGSMVLEITFSKVQTVFINTLLIQAFPLYVLLTCRRRHQPLDTFFLLTLVFDLIGVLEFLLLGESGRRASDGNFGWGMMGAALMLWVVALIRFAKVNHEDFERTHRIGVKHCAGWLLLGWHLLSGIYYIYYLCTSGNVI